MRRSFSTNRQSRRSFLRTTALAGTSLVVAQFGWPRTLRAQGGSYNSYIIQSSDDAAMNNNDETSTVQTFLKIYNKNVTLVGFRFQNVTIPQGTTILSATLTVQLIEAATSSGTFIQIIGALPTSGDTSTFSGAELPGYPTTWSTGVNTGWEVPTTTGTYAISKRTTPPTRGGTPCIR